MKYFVVLFCAGLCLLRSAAAQACEPGQCSSSTCRCATTESPLAVADTPQFVTLTFDDAVQDVIFNLYYQPVLFHLTNPDGRNISATFYVPHEYTDYERVNDLYNKGYEIGINSISKEASSDYWTTANVDILNEEFGGQRQIISHFANVPIEDVTGSRTPNLALAGDNTFTAYVQSGVTHDNSWPSLSSIRYFPYTLDYPSPQMCNIGSCPSSPFPGFWVLPIIDMVSPTGIECNSVLGCGVYTGTAQEISDWLYEQFDRIYGDNRAPMSVLINSAWFATNLNALAGFQSFLDRVLALGDAYLVSHNEVLRWMRNPVPLSQYETVHEGHDAPCVPRICPLDFGLQVRYMKSCVTCPTVYPWLGNPLGQ